MGFLEKLFGSATPWGAVGNAVGGIANGISSIISNKQNLKAQQRENALIRQHTEDMYNKYESPVAQAQQMREAGLHPQGAITPNSVGTASTSSLPASQAPDFGSAIQSMFAIPEAKLSLENLKLQNDSMRQKNETDRLTNMKLAVEANDWESYWSEYKRGLKNTNDKTFYEAQTAFHEARLAAVQANNAEGAQSAGINPVVDEHNESLARIEKLRQDISSSLNSMINDNIRLDMALEKHDIEKRILELERDERQQLLHELLETWDTRESLLNSDISVKKALVDELTRIDELNKERHKYDMHVAKAVSEAIQNGEPIEAILTKAMAEDPSSAIATTLAIGNILHSTGKDIVISQNQRDLPSGAFRH